MIGWENNQGAYFIQKLQDDLNSVSSEADSNKSNIGDMTTLTTTAKDTLVKAVNEVDSHADTANSSIGTLSNLNTSAKTNVVSAVNEVLSDLSYTYVDKATGSSNSVSVDAGWKVLSVIIKIDDSNNFCLPFEVIASNHEANKSYDFRVGECVVTVAIASDWSATLTIYSAKSGGVDFTSTSTITVSKR